MRVSHNLGPIYQSKRGTNKNLSSIIVLGVPREEAYIKTTGDLIYVVEEPRRPLLVLVVHFTYTQSNSFTCYLSHPGVTRYEGRGGGVTHPPFR